MIGALLGDIVEDFSDLPEKSAAAIAGGINMGVKPAEAPIWEAFL